MSDSQTPRRQRKRLKARPLPPPDLPIYTPPPTEDDDLDDTLDADDADDDAEEDETEEIEL